MAGNVSEWVAVWFAPNAYTGLPQANPKGPDHSWVMNQRGGSFADLLYGLRVSARNDSPASTYAADYPLGFRCACDL